MNTMARALLVLVIALGAACQSEQEVKVVDFSRTVDVARPAVEVPEHRRLRVAVSAMVSPKETFASYRELLDYLGRKLDRDVELVQRKTYDEINRLLGENHIDVAFLCSGPYATGKKAFRFQPLATPEVQGSPYYRSYLIVYADSPIRGIEDLRGRTFAFTDPDSNTGRLVPVYWLKELGERPESFFRSSIFTYSHDNSIRAVAEGMVDGACVDGLIWEYYDRHDRTHTSRTRIVRRSDHYGNPPVVAAPGMLPEDTRRIREVLLSMHLDAEGARILKELMIDRFVEPQDDWYNSIREMIEAVASQ